MKTSFWKRRSGNVAAVTAILAPVVIVTGLGVTDYTSAQSFREQLQHATDSGALSAARVQRDIDSNAELKGIAQDMIMANLRAALGGAPESAVTVNLSRTTNRIEVTAEATAKNTFLGILGIETFEIEVLSEVALGASDRPVEVALVSDLSGSMGAQISALRDGMGQITQHLLESANYDGQVRVAYVPYVATVNIGSNAPRDWLDVDGRNPTHGVNFENHNFGHTGNCGRYRFETRTAYYEDKYRCREPRAHSHGGGGGSSSGGGGGGSTGGGSTGGGGGGSDGGGGGGGGGGSEDARLELTPIERLTALALDGFSSGADAIGDVAQELYGATAAEAHDLFRNRTCWGDACAARSECELRQRDARRWNTERETRTHPYVDPDTSEWCEDKSSPAAVNHFDLYEAMTDVSWKGCVEARPNGHDELDTVPTFGDPSTLFVPYFWPDEPDNDASLFFNNWLDDGPTSGVNLRSNNREEFNWSGPPPETGSGIWAGEPNGAGWGYIQPSELNRMAYWRKYDDGRPRDNFTDTPSGSNNATYGPNKACPPAITPLTSNPTTLQRGRAEIAPYAGGGTMSNLGMMWGWRVLSPGSPFTEGNEYGDAHKVAVLMSDGDSNWQWRGDATESPQVKTHYTAYGYLSPLGDESRSSQPTLAAMDHGEFAGSTGAGRRFLDEKLRRICRRMKDQNIEIFTILFDPTGNRVSAETRAAYRDCASSGSDYMFNPGAPHFWDTFSEAELVEAYKAIGASLDAVRLVK